MRSNSYNHPIVNCDEEKDRKRRKEPSPTRRGWTEKAELEEERRQEERGSQRRTVVQSADR